MQNWIERLDAIIQLNGRELLTHAGKISQQVAQERAKLEHDKFQSAQQRIEKASSIEELAEDIKALQKDNK